MVIIIIIIIIIIIDSIPPPASYLVAVKYRTISHSVAVPRLFWRLTVKTIAIVI